VKWLLIYMYSIILLIIVSFYEYTVYIMFWIVMFYDCYYYYCHFLSKCHCFLQCKIRFFLKVIRNPASKPLQSIEISLYLAFTNEWNVAKQEKLLKNVFFLKKYSDSQCCWKKYSDFGGGKKNNLIQSFCQNLMLNPGKKFRAIRDKKNRYSNSRVVRKKNSEWNKKP
jgi:hypothetical protein